MDHTHGGVVRTSTQIGRIPMSYPFRPAAALCLAATAFLSMAAADPASAELPASSRHRQEETGAGASVDSPQATLAPAGSTGSLESTGASGAVAATTDQLVITFRSGTDKARQATVLEAAERKTGLEHPHGIKTTAGGAAVVKNENFLTASEQTQAIRTLEQDPAVESAQPDRIILHGLARTSYGSNANDPGRRAQWHLDAVRAPGAWQSASGRGTTIGLLETGYTDHPDLRSKWVPGIGWDFVSASNSGDGNGRDASPVDEGEPGQPGGKWHGTHVAGIAAAATNNGQGVAGVAPDAQLSMIRVMGLNGGGYESDHADAIRWGAGIDVAGAPHNTHPSQVLNFSEGVLTSCSPVLRRAVQEAKDRNVAVVAAAGNNGVPASQSMPANCGNTVVVGASTPSSARVSWSNYGSTVDLYAPGTGIYSTWNNGICTGWGSCRRGGAGYGYDEGTSMAAPMVAATIAMMKELNPGLTVEQARSTLTRTASHGSAGLVLDSQRAVEGTPLGGAIGTYYRSHGGADRFGHPLGGELHGLQSGGAVMEFSRHRAIYWSQRTGAQEVDWNGDIGKTYRKTGWENGYGYPSGPEQRTADGGAYQFFRDPRTDALNLFLWSPETGTHVVREHSGIGSRWAALGRENAVGYPVDEEAAASGGAYQVFRQRATGRTSLILWSPSTGAHLIKQYGAIGAAWIDAGREQKAGFPLGEEQSRPDGTVAQDFSTGQSFVWHPATGEVTLEPTAS